MDFLSFEMRVQLAVGAALKEDSKCRFYEAMMPSDYSDVHCIFGGGDGQSSLRVKVDFEGNVTGPVRTSWPWLQDEQIEWPVGMDYNTARNLFDDTFPRTAWSQVVLRKPLTYPAVNAEFIFTVGGGYVVVDTVTKRVYRLDR